MAGKFYSFYTLVVSLCLFEKFSISANDVVPRGVPLSRAALYDQNKNFSCLDGSKLIPFSFVNDDYCDCADGTDEPGTSACAKGSFYCLNSGYQSMNIQSTRVNDYVCDCCDGSDEYATGAHCENTCEELGRAAREEAERLTKLEREGYLKRLEMSQKGKDTKKERELEINQLEGEKSNVESLKAEKQKVKEQLEELETKAKELYDQKKEPERIKAEAEKARDMDMMDIEQTFTLLDSDGDGKITLEEIKVRQTFDKNRDGQVSDEEAMHFLNLEKEMTKEEFKNIGYNLMKPFFLLEQGMFKPPVDQEEQQQEESKGPQGEAEEDKGNEAKEASAEDLHKDPASSQTVEADNEESFEPSEIEDEGDPAEDDQVLEEDLEEDAKNDENSSKESDYDEETKQMIEKANKARDEYYEADKKVQELVRKLQDLNEAMSIDYGEDERFAPLLGQCFDFEDREYVYTLCPFKSAHQKNLGAHSSVNLGTWGSWSGPDENKYSSMLYDRGQSCWNGPNRSVKVILICGAENKLIAASEPSRCEYTYEFSTPAACSKPEPMVEHDEL